MMPFNFSTVLERNLSASWYREIPTIKVDAKLDDLKVFINDDVILFHVYHAFPQVDCMQMTLHFPLTAIDNPIILVVNQMDGG